MAWMPIELNDPPDPGEVLGMLSEAGVASEAAEYLLPTLVHPRFHELGLDDASHDGERVRQYLAELVSGIGGVFTAYRNWQAALVHVALVFLGALPDSWWRTNRQGRVLPLSLFMSLSDADPSQEWLDPLLDAVAPLTLHLVTVQRMVGGKIDADLVLRRLHGRGGGGCPDWELAVDWDAEEKGTRAWVAADRQDFSRPWVWLRNAPVNLDSGVHRMFHEDHVLAFVERARAFGGVRESLAVAIALRETARETENRRSGSGGLFGRASCYPLQPVRKVLKRELPGLRMRAQVGGAGPVELRSWLEAASWMAAVLPGEDRVLDPSNEEDRPESDALIAAAGQALGRVRKQLREPVPADRATAIAALRVLRWLDGPWMALRHVQQLMSVARDACSGIDLRYYDGEGLPFVPELAWIPQTAAWVMHSLSVEEREDSTLEAGRADLAGFLLRRLKSKEGGEAAGLQPMEQRREWRYGIIRAVEDLQVNPEGRGHHVLHRVANEDSDDKVKETAKKVYEKMRHARGGEKQLFPKTKFLRAFWWLRYAQRAALGMEVDDARAKSIRSREVSHTQSEYWI